MSGGAAPVVGVLGLGLIGGSLAKAWAGDGGSVVAWSRSESTRLAAASSPDIDVVASIAEVVERADIVVLATPLSTLSDTLDAVASALAGRAQLPTITDVGSVKAPIAAHARAVLPDPSVFVPGHPMAGTEQAGWASADPELFQGARWALGADEPVDLTRWAAVAHLAISVGACVVPVEPVRHDKAVALISHLPYALAAALTSLLGDEPDGLAAALAAGSFRSATRVAGGDGRSLGLELARANGPALLGRVEQLEAWLGALARALDTDDPAALDAAFEPIPAASPATGPAECIPLDRARLLPAGRSVWRIDAIDLDAGVAMGHPLGAGAAS